jgi:hypothetical protein
MDIFFRQLWQDKRLSYDGASELVIGSDMLHKIWLPDTYIGLCHLFCLFSLILSTKSSFNSIISKRQKDLFPQSDRAEQIYSH